MNSQVLKTCEVCDKQIGTISAYNGKIINHKNWRKYY